MKPSLVNWGQRLVLLVVLAIGARGGLQSKPLSQSMAFQNEPLPLGHLTLSAPFTVMEQMTMDRIHKLAWLSEDDSLKIARNLVKNHKTNEIFLDKEHAFYRISQQEHTTGQKPLNVVVIMLESWTARYMASFGGPVASTPNFDSLCKKGQVFDQFYANGSRSIIGIASVLASIPGFTDAQVIMGAFTQNTMTSFPQILEQNGYQTLFLHGGFEGSLGIHDFARKLGYDKVIAKENFENPDNKWDGLWGIWDHFQFERFKQELDSLQEPFHGAIFTSSSHQPFHLPDPEFSVFDSSVPDYEWLNALHYSDWALGQFFEQAKSSSWFKNTVFVITADHTIWAHRGKAVENAHIPLLIYSPSEVIAPGINHTIGSQVDILPSMIDLLGLSTAHSSMGKSLFSETSESFALFNSVIYLWITPDYALSFVDNKLASIYNNHTKVLQEKINFTKLPSDIQSEIRTYLGYTQTAHNTLITNSIAPW
ncbi:MAG: LTA synthase family protein [SAR324 cluster bacterium]|nr:LTA synthase family protein [SAR324 cluster bacterium]